jgi:hypothetical protein
MLRPFGLKGSQNLALGFAVDDVDSHRVRLLESLNAVYRLYEIVELEPDARKDFPMAVPLKITAAASDYRLCRKHAEFPIAKVNDAPFALFQVLTAPNADGFRNGRLQSMPLSF